MTEVLDLPRIRKALEGVDALQAMEEAFVAYSEGRTVVPPVGELLFDAPPGDAHIKYGYIRGDRWFVIKVATGFYDNPKVNLPSNSGLMLIFDARTGLPHMVLLDEGHLTNVRTAAAGAYAAKLLAPPNVECIGVIGSGVQARMQLEYLESVTPCRKVCVFARDAEKKHTYASEMGEKSYDVIIADTPAEVAANAALIVTTTASNQPLLHAKDIRQGTHITAMGSDTPHKQELAVDILAKCDVLAVDSIAQCRERGESFHAISAGVIQEKKLAELGALARREGPLRSDDAVTVADLTGVAVQDIEICKAVMGGLENASR